MDHLCGLWSVNEDGLEALDPTMTALGGGAQTDNISSIHSFSDDYFIS